MKKYLGRLDLFCIVVGEMIGWGSFMLPGTKFLKAGGVINTTLGLFLGAFCMLVIEQNYEVMMSLQNEEGGEFSFAYNNLGRHHGFIVGWFLTLAYFTIVPFNATAFPLVINKITGGALEFGYLYDVAGYRIYLGEILVSSVMLLFFAYLNIRGVKESSIVQTMIIFALITMVTAVFIGMVIKGDRAGFAEHYVSGFRLKPAGIARVFAITPFLLLGFDTVPQLCGEYRFSHKKASMVAVFALLSGTLIYALLNSVAALAYGPEEAFALDWAVGSAVQEKLGGVFFAMLIIALSAAVWSGMNGFILTSAKLLGAIANYGMLPAKMGKLNKNGVYSSSIMFITGISLIAPWFGRDVLNWIVDMSSLGAAIAYAYVCYIVYKKRAGTPGKILAAAGVAVSLMFALLLVIPGSPACLGKESMAALVIWCVLGAIFYARLKRSEKRSSSGTAGG